MLSLILPTYNEATNIVSLLDTIEGALQHTQHEVIVVDDDSPDGTWRVAMGLTQRYPALRVIRRVDKKGLSSAVMDGFVAAQGTVLAVMDADGQHDPALLIAMLKSIEAGNDLVIGSRYIAGGSVGEWITGRRFISRAGTFVALRVARVRVSDPLGGFFAMRASLYRSIASTIQPTGFKILLEVLAHVPAGTRVAEIPLIFRMRLHGSSKLSAKVQLEFMVQVLRLALTRLGSLAWVGTAVFAVVSGALALALLPRAAHLLPLVIDQNLRDRTRTALERVAAREGWRISDIELLSITAQTLQVRMHEHLRSPQPLKICTIGLDAPYPLQCAG